MAGDLDLDALERLATDEDRDREELETVADAFPRVLSRLRAAEARGAAKALEWSEDDRPLPEDAEIKAAHPMRTGRHDLYGEAMRLVGARYSKGALVDLVVWLLHRADAAEARVREQEAKAARARVIRHCACVIAADHTVEARCSIHEAETAALRERVRELEAERDAALAAVRDGFPGIVSLVRERAEQAEKERDEARDCGQDGVCALSPGCQRHWQERNTELAREADTLERLGLRNAAEMVETDRERDLLRAVADAARAVAGERFTETSLRAALAALDAAKGGGA